MSEIQPERRAEDRRLQILSDAVEHLSSCVDLLTRQNSELMLITQRQQEQMAELPDTLKKAMIQAAVEASANPEIVGKVSENVQDAMTRKAALEIGMSVEQTRRKYATRLNMALAALFLAVALIGPKELAGLLWQAASGAHAPQSR